MRPSKFKDKGKAKSAVMQRKYRPLVEDSKKGKSPYKRPSPGSKLEE